MDIKVGDVVAWDKVPSGALVRVSTDAATSHALRIGDQGEWVGFRFSRETSGEWRPFCRTWPWSEGAETGSVTIIALDVPADATAEQLRTLAEVFEVREALHAMHPLDALVATGGFGPDAVVYTFDEAAPLLHHAGWRPSMSAEDAARMLAEVHDGEG